MQIKQESVLGSNKRINFLGTKIDVLDMHETVSLVEKYIQRKEYLHLVGVNADKINQMKKNNYLQNIINSCGVINADGASVIIASRFLGMPLPERVSGIDLMDELMKMCQDKGYSIFLLGAKEQIVRKTSEIVKRKYAKIKIKGVRNGYFTEDQWGEVSSEIKHAAPDIVFVGITSPIKEYLVEYLQNEGNNCVFMGVGGSFDVVSGQISRAPKWMQKVNLEWFYRMLNEPKRLGKRYLKGNLEFILRVISTKFSDNQMVDDK